MGAFSIIEDRPTPREVYNARIYIFAATCVCSFSSAAAVDFELTGSCRRLVPQRLGTMQLSSAPRSRDLRSSR
jgi:hypothetical protein